MWAGIVARLVGFRGAAIGLAFAAALLFGGWQAIRADRLELKLEAATARTAELQARIETQNEGLRLVKRAADAQLQVSQRAAMAARRALSTAEARAARIEAAPTPTTCQDAIQFLVVDAAGGAL